LKAAVNRISLAVSADDTINAFGTHLISNEKKYVRESVASRLDNVIVPALPGLGILIIEIIAKQISRNCEIQPKFAEHGGARCNLHRMDLLT
jgi:3-methyladenine DNA glycosylase AlkC